MVAAGLGGYSPWAVLVLESGAALLGLTTLVVQLEAEGSSAVRARYRAWRRLPWFLRYPGLHALGRWASFGFMRRRAMNEDVEFVLPTGGGREITLDPSREAFLGGIAYRRSGLLLPLGLMTLWIGLSLVPLPRGWLALLSPRAHEIRIQSEALVGAATPLPSPWSLVPFLTARDLWIWIAVVTLFVLTMSLVRVDSRNATRLGASLVVLGALSGLYGVVGWLDAVTEAFGVASSSIRARGSFGNANHYAMFQGMTVLVGLGLLGGVAKSPHTRARHRNHHRLPRDDRGRAGVIGLAVVIAALGLALSLSRSGIAFTLVAACVFVLLYKVGEATKRSFATANLALGLALLALLVWLGTEPLVARFGDLAAELDREGTRVQVWRDSLSALDDFWLTGAGLASFRYVGTSYRTFAGNIFYSWAHNDFLQLALELGLPGVLLLGLILVATVRAVRRARRDLVQEPARAALHAGFVSALVFVACHSATDFGLHLPANLALLALITAGAVAMEQETRSTVS